MPSFGRVGHFLRIVYGEQFTWGSKESNYLLWGFYGRTDCRQDSIRTIGYDPQKRHVPPISKHVPDRRAIASVDKAYGLCMQGEHYYGPGNYYGSSDRERQNTLSGDWLSQSRSKGARPGSVYGTTSCEDTTCIE